jgi:L-ascorbate metabolism protein UlaG (beta-lactamase superfamily)
MTEVSLKNIHWLGHSSFRIDDIGTQIYIDPWQLEEGSKPADLILITHDHRDHCSPEDVAKIQNQETIIVTVDECESKLDGDVRLIQPGDSTTIKGVAISAVPAYNIDKFRSPGVPFHPKEKNYVGFIIILENLIIYHAGDTDFIPEMELVNADVALLPVSGKYVMTANEALEAAKIISPKVIVPMHIGRGIGSQDDAQYLKSKSTIPVRILPVEK